MGWVLVPIGIFYFQKSLKPPTFLRKQYSIPSFFLFFCFFLGGVFFIYFFKNILFVCFSGLSNHLFSDCICIYVLNKGYVWFFFLLILIRIRHWSAHANDLKWCTCPPTTNSLSRAPYQREIILPKVCFHKNISFDNTFLSSTYATNSTG